MIITDEQIKEWQELKGDGFTSAIGEYTPDEFWDALREIEDLRGALTDLVEQIEQVDGTAQLSIELAKKVLGRSA